MASTPDSEGSVIKVSANSNKSLYQTPSPFEEKIGYYRAVRHGSHIFVSGTTAVDPSSPVSAPQIKYPGNAGKQAHVAFGECLRAVSALGGSPESVVRVRMFVARHDDCDEVGKTFRAMFTRAGSNRDGDMGTAATMIVVRDGFVNKDMLVEVEVDAMVDQQ